MFRFWISEPRGSDKIAEAAQPMPQFTESTGGVSKPSPKQQANHAVKRKRQSADGADERITSKRAKVEAHDKSSSVGGVACKGPPVPKAAGAACDVDRAREVIQYQFGLEILLKHDEIRLIDQELAKCQIALEQLRRCHLIPYPISCPTPEQMLDISKGKGPSVRSRPGQSVPKWAAPFGVVDGPYARHYAKWLIPDPAFDGVLPEWHGFSQAPSAALVPEGRTTRNSLSDPVAVGKNRPMRGTGAQKLHALSNGYPQPKDKAGPCILKRSDGQTVKLVCIDCHRDNFSSTQGFINHCRIAHKRDFKSHEEAAVHCGHPIEADENRGTTSEEKPAGVATASGLVHAFAHTDKEDSNKILSRIHATLTACSDRSLDTSSSKSRVSKSQRPTSSKGSRAFVSSDQTPFLSNLMKNKKFKGNLKEQVEDAKTKIDLDELSPGDESEEGDQSADLADGLQSPPASAARTPAVKRMPVRPTMAPAAMGGTRPASSKGVASHMAFSTPDLTPTDEKEDSSELYDDDMDTEHSPNTIASNNAPSLVSDDGEYDDSDDGSSSEISDSDAGSVSDVAEINIDEDDGPQAIRHHRGSTSTKKDEPKHVTFVGPVTTTGKGRRKQKA
ncbi:uncharacterized protein E0L32_007111 [Thyridium curvatum]|uniref:AHC1-like C2H2 zinc-finger domain-containing protein n=1 Tax=Thyridium curvatum TaxID=1093900 RepID=A0A507AN82_9PEZI|nr:uncharacterized protein E0L32_007111 [Thyridium curvatum]TPX12225.1 hypothetical protein E0L32_007111 [Thyridium curvatum]